MDVLGACEAVFYKEFRYLLLFAFLRPPHTMPRTGFRILGTFKFSVRKKGFIVALRAFLLKRLCFYF